MKKNKVKQRIGKTIQNMQNKNSVKVKGSYKNKTTSGIEMNYWRSKGYDVKRKKVKNSYLVFRSKKKV
jgi:hypothetical protein